HAAARRRAVPPRVDRHARRPGPARPLPRGLRGRPLAAGGRGVRRGRSRGMKLRIALESAARREAVSPDVLEAAFGEIMDGKASPVAIAGLLVALRTKGETVDEIVAAARALRARAETAP